MAFIRRKKVRGRVYFQLVENFKEKGKRKQKVIKHLGDEYSAKEYCRKHKIPFEIKEYEAKPTGLFESIKEASEFTTALKGRSEIPLKFEYLKDGVRRWNLLTRSKNYEIGVIETELIKKVSKEILKDTTEKINLIDLGCGTGEKGMLFLEKLKRYKKKYVALDISEQMLNLAKTNLSKKFSHLNSEFHKLDFEGGNFAYITENLREKNYLKSLILFLGNTLGNVSDKSRVLSNIRESMTLKDNLLIGLELFDPKRIGNILKHYRGNKLWQDNIFTVLNYFGLKQEDGFFEVNFNKEKSQVEARFVMKKSKEVISGSKKMKLKEGTKILLMISYKAAPKNMQILLAETGFIIQRVFLNENEDYALFLCKPSKL